MKIRMHRGGLAESMETAAELKRWQDLEKFCEKYGININTIKCEHYSGPDDRINWEDIWIVLASFQNETEIGPVAFSDGDVTELEYDNEEEMKALTDLNSFDFHKITEAQSVAIYLEKETGPIFCKFQRAYAAGYRQAIEDMKKNKEHKVDWKKMKKVTE